MKNVAIGKHSCTRLT